MARTTSWQHVLAFTTATAMQCQHGTIRMQLQTACGAYTCMHPAGHTTHNCCSGGLVHCNKQGTCECNMRVVCRRCGFCQCLCAAMANHNRHCQRFVQVVFGVGQSSISQMRGEGRAVRRKLGQCIMGALQVPPVHQSMILTVRACPLSAPPITRVPEAHAARARISAPTPLAQPAGPDCGRARQAKATAPSWRGGSHPRALLGPPPPPPAAAAACQGRTCAPGKSP